MEVTMILTVLVLNILLPTADVVTDINLVVKLYGQPAPDCGDDGHDQSSFDGMKECIKDPATFCSDHDNKKHCKFYQPHYKMATALIIPFILNYLVCFYTFFRLTTNRKKYLFIFPLLDLYPQYGKPQFHREIEKSIKILLQRLQN